MCALNRTTSISIGQLPNASSFMHEKREGGVVAIYSCSVSSSLLLVLSLTY